MLVPMQTTTPDKVKPFAIPVSALPFRGRLARVAAPILERALGLDGINGIYDSASAQPGDVCFSDKVLATMQVRYRVSQDNIARIPRSGPVIVVANHPFGGIDGVVLHSLLRKVRRDVRLMVTHLLDGMPEYQSDFLFFDNFGSPDAPARNLAAMKTAIRFVKDGGVLGVFPAGEVSHRTRLNPEIVDPAWSDSIARLIQITGASVLPIYFDGHNSRLFQFAGLIHPRLRTALLGHEILRRRRTTVRMQMGSVISPGRIAEFESPIQLTAYLRTRTYILQSRCRQARDLRKIHSARHAPIASETPAEAISREILQLAPEQTLLEQSSFRVLVGRAHQMPHVLCEIGRLREITFRKAGEGTGKHVDLDRFDNAYLHLFVWQKEQREIVGAYRLGLTDEILPQHGIDGLYTATLFKYRHELLQKIHPAIELGRSFVRPEYQREYAPLLLLWKGIGKFVARHPRYKMLLGPVSISNDYNSLSKQLLVAFLRTSALASDLARWVTPRNPFRAAPSREMVSDLATVDDIDRVDELVSEIESNTRGVPVLFKQYLKLNAKLLAFNVDPDFGDVLDGLMLADLTSVNCQILNRYMGRDAAERFLAYHRV